VNEPADSLTTLVGTTAIVTGASRGFGRGISAALSEAGAHVVGVARTRADLDKVRAELGDTFTAVAADAADSATAERLIDEYRPRTIVLCAGAIPTAAPLQDQTWETFSENWEVDVAQAFHWSRAALLRPLTSGSTVIAISSAAAIGGSPVSGGYAGANATVKFIAGYAALESQRIGLGIRFVALLPQLMPSTGVGAAAVEAYAQREGVDIETFLKSRGPTLTAEQAAKFVLDLAVADESDQRAYMLSADGLSPLR
jgi:NAD(P)-dependent dehydrogenase (short-subunit alcohol dehydrogenase family)